MKVNDMKKKQSGSFTSNPLVVAVLLAMGAQLPTQLAMANGAFGTNTDVAGTVINVPTYFANSPQGIQPAYDLVTHALSKTVTVDTGAPLRKFIDPLAGAYNGLDGAGIPVAITEKWVNPLVIDPATGQPLITGDDYYEIAIVEYTENMHSDLVDYDPLTGAVLIDPATGKPKLHGTRLRGYVQIETPNLVPIANGGLVGKKDITGLIGSEHIPATYPDGTPITDIGGNPVFFVHQPHYLGPVILAAKGTPVRIKATNYLPYTNAAGVSVGSWNGMGGELPIPVDETIAGGGPVLDKNGQPVLDQNGQPIKMAQNRAAIHWHGGDTPWISDGTPHQWFTPAGDISYTIGDAQHPVKSAAHPNGVGMGKGDSAQDVPDMPPSGDGSYTLYFPNNLSGRLMMYHDHTSGLTKLNVYDGMAAGYVVYDPVELTMVAKALGTTLGATPVKGPFAGTTLPSGLLDSVGIPLVIQDKTFVPKNIGNPAINPNAVASDHVTPASQDAKWDLTHWGQPGDLFFPHVYETNQDPNSIDGTNPVGRWDWGPWFWPVFPAQMSLPTGEYGHVTATPEAFMDTAVVNGQAFPSLTVDPKTYRFRILSVGNDRTINLGLYQAVDANNVVCDAKNTTPAIAPTAPGGAAPVACTEVKMVPALPTAGYPASWPIDGRPGGVPDPATAGPDIVQIGNEGGLLPAPAIWKSQPVGYESNVRSITVFNILQHDLLLGGGERADVLIDFSKYAGQTLLVYNDAPAPMPGFDPRIDFRTGGGDNSGVGSSFDILPGYGPNTRTVMKIVVNATNTSGTGGALDTTALANAMPAAYAATQPTPIIPEVAYNAPFGTTSVNNYAAIGTGSLATNGLFTYKEMVGGVLTVKTLPVINKAIQELFDPIYGRMNATLAVELPFSSATVATTIPLAYIDVPVESLDAIKDGETQIWKITHNGVDGHPVHFHMVNVQVINRVSWDGTIRPPEANEVGWKETLRMNPLEDVYVAVKAVRPVVPFGLPKSTRLLDPSQSVDSSLGFTQIDPTSGQAPITQTQLVGGVMTPVQLLGNPAIPLAPNTYSNQLTEFDNEYVWHCHILGHEEQDFMRPFVFHPNVVKPDMPTVVGVAGTTLTWIDPTPYGGVDASGVPTAGTVAGLVGVQYAVAPTNNPKNEIGFKVRESIDGGVTFTTVATVPANVTTWTGANAANAYQVIAYNVAGDSLPGVVVAQVAPAAAAPLAAPLAAPALAGAAGPTGLTVSLNADGTATLSWVAVAGATGYSINGVSVAATCDPVTSICTATTGVLAAGVTAFTVTAQTLNGDTAAASGSLWNGNAYAPVALTSTQGNKSSVNNSAPRGSVTLTWANNPKNLNNVTGLTLSWTLQGGGGVATNGSKTFAPTSTGTTVINLSRDKDYRFTLTANSNKGPLASVSIMGLSKP
jgi:FtsP/CotA-like multicopper oxidase with cupredoxin domain